MRCHICNTPLESPTYNRKFKNFDPCTNCREVIATVFDDFIEEDEFREGLFEEEFDNEVSDLTDSP